MISLSIIAEEDAERVLDVTAKKDDLLPRLNDYMVARKTLKHQLLERDDILKDMKASVKQVEMAISCLDYEKRPLEKANEKLMERYAK